MVEPQDKDRFAEVTEAVDKQWNSAKVGFIHEDGLFYGNSPLRGNKAGKKHMLRLCYCATRYPETVPLRSSEEEPDTFIVECGEGTKITITDALSGVATN